MAHEDQTARVPPRGPMPSPPPPREPAPAPPPAPADPDLPTQVAGLQGWVGALDRIIGIRTRVLLVLVALAIGGAGAAINLALDAGSDKASKADVNRLRDQVEAGGTAAGGDLQTQID